MFRSKEKSQLKVDATNRKRAAYQASKTKAGRHQKEKEEKEKTALSSVDLLVMLKNCSNFLGVFAVDEIKNLSIKNFPSFFILNIMERKYQNGHWISLRIDRQKIEIFDSLGCEPSNWGHYPLSLFQFLNSYSQSHSFIVTPLLQPAYSSLCGYYCAFFILARQKNTFRKLLKHFTRDLDRNDKILCDQLSKYID